MAGRSLKLRHVLQLQSEKQVKGDELDGDIPIWRGRRTIHLHEHRDTIPSICGSYGKT